MKTESVRVYIDAAGKWRWRHRRGSRIVAASTQGYSTKQWCMDSLEKTLQASYELLSETRKTPNRRAHQLGVLTRWEGGATIPVEVTPWGLES